MPARPRLTVFRSAKHIYAQVIDDLTGRTVVSASTNEKGVKVANGGNRDAAARGLAGPGPVRGLCRAH